MVLLIDPAVMAELVRHLHSHTRIPPNGAVTVTGYDQETMGAFSVFAILTQISRHVMQDFNLVMLVGVL